MPLVVKDRVRETTTTTGTGTITLGGAVSGFQSFSVIGNANTTYYAIVDSTSGSWEVGIGTYTSAGTTLSRDTVLESSNSGSLVSFSAGTKDVFCTYPAERSLYVDGSAIVPATAATLGTSSGGTGLTTFTAANNALYSTSASALTAGTLPSAAGGTGLTTFTAANNALYSTSASALTAGTLPAAAGGTGLTTFTAANNAIYSTSASSLTAGTLPSAAGGTGLTTFTAANNAIYSTSASALTAGTLPLAAGGTGKTTAPAANAELTGFTTTATAGGTTTLTNTSSYYQVFTGTSAQTVQLPATSTLAQGWSFHIVNNGTGTLTLNTSTSVTLGTIPPGITVMATALTTSGNTATDWEFGYTDFSLVKSSGTLQLIGASSTTSITSPLAWNSDNFSMYAATAQAANFTISADSGSPVENQKMVFRITSDATPRVVTFTGGASKAFKPVGVTLTASGSDFTYTLTASKTTYFGCIYNTTSARWEVVALSQEV